MLELASLKAKFISSTSLPKKQIYHAYEENCIIHCCITSIGW